MPTFLFLLLCSSPIVLAERWGPWSERGGTLAHAASISAHSATRFTSHSRSTSFVTLSQCLLSDVLLSGLPVVGSHVVRSPTSLYTPHSVGITDSLSADFSCAFRALLHHFQCHLRARYRCSPKLHHSYLDQLRFHRVLSFGLVSHSNMVIYTPWHLHQMHCNNICAVIVCFDNTPLVSA